MVKTTSQLITGTILIVLFSWYKRSEFGIRAAIFFSAATVSGAFGGLLAVRNNSTWSGYTFTNFHHRLRFPTWTVLVVNLLGK